MQSLVIVNRPKDWNFHIDGAEVVEAKEYLTDSRFARLINTRVYNLCRSYRYQSVGYYVSLLAEARGHRALPDVTTIQDFKSLSIIRTLSTELDQLIQRSFRRLKSHEFTLSIYFGRNTAKQYDRLCRQLFNLFRAPLIRAQFQLSKKRWTLQSIYPIPVSEIPDFHREYVQTFATEYFKRKRWRQKRATKSTYDLAILVNPDEKEPPSDARAIQKFTEAAESLGFYTEIVTAAQYANVPQFDALFIRETTTVNHHTYRFSRRAQAEGMVVIDDPLSILRCANKVYLAERLSQNGVAIPKTLIVHRKNVMEIEKHLSFPCVLKKPDSAFSQDVCKAESLAEVETVLEKYFLGSDLLVAQVFMPTEFDWRIGVLDQQALYACKYYMARGHWQIYNWGRTQHDAFGRVETLPLHEVPENVIKTAVRAANLIGDGFYGVDLKQNGNETVVIEVNDNPSIDSGIEDRILKDRLYEAVMRSFLSRLQRLQKFRGRSVS